MLESVESTASSTSADAGPGPKKARKSRPKAKAKRTAARAGKKTARKAARAKNSGAKGKGGKTSFVIWVDAKQGAYIKAKAKKAGLSQADYFRRALKLPVAAK